MKYTNGFLLSKGMQMLIKLQDYQEGEIIPVQHQYDPKKLEVESVDLRYTGPLDMEGTVEKGPDVLTFRGHLQSRTELLCGRCLEKTPSELDKDFEFYYEVRGKDSVDATDDIRELLILEQPLAYVCSEKCRGLCSKCGMNLNETSCSCTQEPENSLSKLSDIWKKKSAEGGSASGGKKGA